MGVGGRSNKGVLPMSQCPLATINMGSNPRVFFLIAFPWEKSLVYSMDV